MSTPHERRRALARGLVAVGGIGAVATLGTYVVPGLAMIFVGGSEYSEIESQLWLFAVLGTILSMLQLLVYAVLAGQGRRSVYAPWAGLAAVVALGLMCDRPTALLAVVVSVDAVLLAALIAVSLYLARAMAEPKDATAEANRL